MPMIDDEFYFERELSQSEYGSTPNGNLAVNRLIQQKTCWKKPRGKTMRENKTLLFEDNFLAKLSGDDNKLKVLINLAELHAAGFELNYISFGQTKDLWENLPMLWGFEARSSSKSVTHDKVLNIISKSLKKSTDEVLVISDEKFINLLCKTNDTTSLDIETLNFSSVPIGKEALSKILISGSRSIKSSRQAKVLGVL